MCRLGGAGKEFEHEGTDNIIQHRMHRPTKMDLL